jgi:recombination protein RecT
MSNQLSIREQLSSPKFAAEIAKVLPKHVTPERMARAAVTAIMRTPQLAECDQASFFNAMMLLSQWGLEPDGRNAHLIPFRNNKRGVIECQLIIDYKGLVELIDRSGLVSKIHCDKVCENDEFVYDCGEIKRHFIDFRKPRGPAYAFYCIIEKRDGGKKCEVMTIDEIDEIRNRSRSGQSGPWVTDYAEMAKKTVFKRASKWVSLSPEIRDAIHHDDSDLVIDAKSTPVQASGSAALMAAIAPPKETPDYAAMLASATTAAALESLRSVVMADEITDANAAVLQEVEDRLAVLNAEQ